MALQPGVMCRNALIVVQWLLRREASFQSLLSIVVVLPLKGDDLWCLQTTLLAGVPTVLPVAAAKRLPIVGSDVGVTHLFVVGSKSELLPLPVAAK